MVRARSGVPLKRGRKRMRKLTKGFRQSRHNLYRQSAVALIRSFGAWPKVMEGSVWSQRQIRRAMSLGLGVTGPDQIDVITASVGGGSAEFERLMERIRQELARV
jgi:hypothetical protein